MRRDGDGRGVSGAAETRGIPLARHDQAIHMVDLSRNPIRNVLGFPNRDANDLFAGQALPPKTKEPGN
jgi:hypothetical protein